MIFLLFLPISHPTGLAHAIKFEVYYLSWPEVLDNFKAFMKRLVKRIMKEQKKRFRMEIRKDDYTDAVLLAFISPKYHR